MCSTSGFVRKLFNKDPSITAHVPLNAPKDVKLALNSCGFLQLCDIWQVPGLVSTDCVVSFSTLLGSRHDAETLAPASQVTAMDEALPESRSGHHCLLPAALEPYSVPAAVTKYQRLSTANATECIPHSATG